MWQHELEVVKFGIWATQILKPTFTEHLTRSDFLPENDDKCIFIRKVWLLISSTATMKLLRSPQSIEAWIRDVHANCSIPPPPVTEHSLTYIFSGHYGHQWKQELPQNISSQINRSLQCSIGRHNATSMRDLPHPITNPLVRIDIVSGKIIPT